MTAEFPAGLLPASGPAGISRDEGSPITEGLAQLLGPQGQGLMYRWASPELVGGALTSLLHSCQPWRVHRCAPVYSVQELLAHERRALMFAGSNKSFLRCKLSQCRLRCPPMPRQCSPSPPRAQVELLQGQAQAPGPPGQAAGGQLTPRQELVVANLVRVDAMIAAHVAKQDEDRTTQFL